MTNKQLAKAFQLTASLLELHDENAFKVRSYQGTATRVENLDTAAAELNHEQLIEKGFSQSMAEKIALLVENGSFIELDKLLETTPQGVIAMLSVSGLGTKKVHQIWKELHIETLDELLEQAQNGKLEKIKGFGKKTAENIVTQIEFLQQQTGKQRIDVAFQYANYVLDKLRNFSLVENVALAGQVAMHEPTIDNISLVVATDDLRATHDFLNNLDGISIDIKNSSPFMWRGFFDEISLTLTIYLTKQDDFYGKLLRESSVLSHLTHSIKNTSLLEVSYEKNNSIQEIYQKIDLQEEIIAPLRNGLHEWDWAKANKIENVLQLEDLKGCIHNHSTYSDGQNSVHEMAQAAQNLGHSYLVMSDHSQSAFYANGLSVERVHQQWKEIDELNTKNSTFKIFKGIESDILTDGSLDYDETTLQGFDVVIASVHSGLKMSEEKATERILKAIQNPYTNILGHPTGRLLLRREGYPINHKKIIEACAVHHVAIEINANPYRLDLDWTWIEYAMRYNVWLCISPDAHSTQGLKDSKWGVLLAQKGGLLKQCTLNTLTKEEFEKWLVSKKAR